MSEMVETLHPGGVVICGDCGNPLHDSRYHLWGARDANGRREKVCIDEPVFAARPIERKRLT